MIEFTLFRWMLVPDFKPARVFEIADKLVASGKVASI
jgi:hypothetical protein